MSTISQCLNQLKSSTKNYATFNSFTSAEKLDKLQRKVTMINPSSMK